MGAAIGTTTEIFQNRRLRFAGASVFGRLANGVTVENARAEMAAIGSQLSNAYPDTNRDLVPLVRTFTQAFIGADANLTYKAMWGAVGFLLLIVCANLANLMLARAIGRTREISIRSALGAAQWRIIRQLLIESVTLSGLGGVLGLIVATGGVRSYQRIAAPPTSYTQWVYLMDYRVFAYVVAITIVAGMLFGLAPALRLSKLDIHTTLKDGGRGSSVGRRGRRLSSILVTGEMALAVVLLAGAGVMIRSFINIYKANRGIQAEKVLTADVRLPLERYPSREARLAFFDRLKALLEAIPGMESVSFSDGLPGGFASQASFETGNAPVVDEKHRATVSVAAISPEYFRTLGALVLTGRPFSDADNHSGDPVALVNERFARSVWPGEDPIGKRVRIFDGTTPDSWRTVVGMVSNIVQNDATGQRFDPIVYAPVGQRPGGGGIVIARTSVPPASIGPLFRRTIQESDPNLVIYSWGTLADSLSFRYWNNGVNAGLFLVFAVIGVTNFVLKLGMLPVAIGLILGLAASLAVNQVLRTQLAGVSPSDPFTLSAALSLLIFAALLGCLLPARRATRVDPVVALRHE